MKGVIRMILISASVAATLACQGCVQTNTAAYPTMDYASSPQTRVMRATQVTKPALATDVTVVVDRRTTTSNHTVFEIHQIEPTPVRTAPLNLQLSKPFSASRLYSGQTLTTLASDREQSHLSPVPKDLRRVEAEIALSAPAERTGLAFDVGIAPRVSITREGDFETQRFGGELRIGQNFDRRGELEPFTGWYLFAGADGEALVWEPDSTGNMSLDDMALRDKVTVGDIQAGVSFQRSGGQLSFSYIRREVEYRERNLGASENEDFAGVTFTMRR